jgi:hypothetical protein
MHQPPFLFAARRIMSIKNFNDIVNRTHDLPACSAASQPTEPRRYSCQIFKKLEFSRKIFEKYSNVTFHKNLSGGSRVLPCGRTDMSKRMVAFRNFANAPKNGLYSERKIWSSYIQGAYDWEGRERNSKLDPKERMPDQGTFSR